MFRGADFMQCSVTCRSDLDGEGAHDGIWVDFARAQGEVLSWLEEDRHAYVKH